MTVVTRTQPVVGSYAKEAGDHANSNAPGQLEAIADVQRQEHDVDRAREELDPLNDIERGPERASGCEYVEREGARCEHEQPVPRDDRHPPHLPLDARNLTASGEARSREAGHRHRGDEQEQAERDGPFDVRERGLAATELDDDRGDEESDDDAQRQRS